MKILIAVCLVAFALAQTPKPPPCDYSNNEVFSRCYGHCGLNCGDPDPKGCTKVCMAGCICRTGFARDANGRCIPKNKCPATPCDVSKNEVFSQCNGHCGPRCGDPEPKICTMVCMAGCICRTGFAMDANGRCIPKYRCPQVVTPPPPPKCRANMVLKNCVSPCQKKPTCEDPNPPEPMCKAMCRPMCVCKPGFVNSDEGECIPLSWCRTCKTKKCKDGYYCQMLYPPCPPPPNPPPPNYCPPLPVCRKCVVPECLKFIKCGYGVAKDSNGCYTCNCNPPPVPIEPCTLSCPRGQICVNNGAREYCVDRCKAFEVFNPCASACGIEPTCAVPIPPSPKICMAVCVEKCLCADGDIRDENNRCIHENECPTDCPANQHLDNCTMSGACYGEATCYDTNPQTPSGIMCPAVCVKRCVCDKGLVRAANGQCVSPYQCPVQ